VHKREAVDTLLTQPFLIILGLTRFWQQVWWKRTCTTLFVISLALIEKPVYNTLAA
jgi:fucose 4-O-acetylase-like acetyltransferase